MKKQAKKKKKENIGAVIKEAGSSIRNKTGDWRTLRPVVLSKKCNLCKICTEFCPDGAIKIKGKKLIIDYNYCKGCGICAVECPMHAIIMKKEEK